MKRTSIRVRLLIMMVCLTTLPIIIVTVIATNNMRNTVEKEIVRANVSRTMWATQYLEELIEQLDRMFYSLQINDELMEGMSYLDSQDVGIQFKTQNYLSETLSTAFYANSRKIDELILYVHENRKSFKVSFNVNGKIDILDIQNEPWHRLESSEKNIYFEQLGEEIYAVHTIKRFPDKKLQGGIAVRINSDVWNEIGVILQSESESVIYLLNDEMELLSGSTQVSDLGEVREQISKLDDLDHESRELIKTFHYHYFIQKIDEGKLIIVKAIPVTMIKAGEIKTIKAGLLTGGIFVAISIILSILFSLRISRPIVSLAKTMSKAKIHDFEVNSGQSIDEIVLLENGYNSMMKRLKELIEEEYQHEIDLKNAQLQALQAQINPHFLNNTLQLIGGLALKKNIPEIYDVARRIGDLLRYSISNDDEMVTIDDELNNLRNYLMIQEKRFAGRCQVKVTVDESARWFLIPKFTLQPIVENAFEYGLQPKLGAWKLEIRVSNKVNRIAIMVKDNGIGISEKDLAQTRSKLKNEVKEEIKNESLKEGRRGTGIGLKNVDARLKLKFGQSFGVRIYSSTGVGTLVVLVVGKKEWEGKDELQGIDN